MPGAITTCYSFKGGSGRSMSLANIAWSLAARGRSVLAVDWDLEAPGLHRYFHPFLSDPGLESTEGLIDGLWRYVRGVPGGAGKRPSSFADFSDYALRLSTPFKQGGAIDLIPAGRQDSEYTAKVGGFDWNLFYERMNGRDFIDAFGTWARNKYDHILIDSRTGVSDTAGICTVQLPDTVALFFVYNRQSIEGTAAAGRAVLAQRKRPVIMIACPSRVEDRRQADPARWYAASCLEDVLKGPTKNISDELRVAEVQHFSWCGFEEKLAVFEDRPDETGTLLQSMDALTDRIAGQRPPQETVPQESLAALWRRAAFMDPRLEELTAMRGASLAQRLPQIKLWLAETLEEDQPNRAWASGLAQEAAGLLVSSNARDVAELDALGEAVVSLARNILKRDNDALIFTEVMRARATQLRREGRLEEAYATVSEAVDASAARGGAGAIVDLRALELRAEIARMLLGAPAAVPLYRALVDRAEKGTRKLGAMGSSIRPRAHRALAEALLDAGDVREARTEADTAVRLAARLPTLRGPNGTRRINPEPALARTIQAQAAVIAGDPDARDLVRRTLEWARRAELPKANRLDLEVKLRTAVARQRLLEGDSRAAAKELQSFSEELPAWAVAEVATLRARISASQPFNPDKAVDPDEGAQALAEYLQAAVKEAGQDPALREMVLKRALTRVVDASGDNVRLLFGLMSSNLDGEMRSLIQNTVRDMIGGSARQVKPEK